VRAAANPVPVIDPDMVPTDAPSDEEVLGRVLAGETAAYGLLMRKYNRRLFRIARAVLQDDPEAEDVVQQAWVNAYENLAQFSGRARFSTWVTRIAFHEALRRRRQSLRATSEATDDDEGEPMDHLPHSGPTPEDAAAGREIQALLERAVDELPAGLRVALVLREVEGLDTAEAAEVLGIAPGALKVRLFRARAELQRAIEERTGESLPHLFGFDGARCDRIVAAVMRRIACWPPAPPGTHRALVGERS
jgi:RNA polymerase sigma-70 factor, ECF subfamily